MDRLDPDIVKKINKYVGSGMTFFGQSVTLRKFVTASAGIPDAGIADLLMYQNRPVQMQLQQLSLEEAQAAGGYDIFGTYRFLSIEPVSNRDEIIYLGETYKVVSIPDKEILGSPVFYNGIMERQSVTAQFG